MSMSDEGYRRYQTMRKRPSSISAVRNDSYLPHIPPQQPANNTDNDSEEVGDSQQQQHPSLPAAADTTGITASRAVSPDNNLQSRQFRECSDVYVRPDIGQLISYLWSKEEDNMMYRTGVLLSKDGRIRFFDDDSVDEPDPFYENKFHITKKLFQTLQFRIRDDLFVGA
jgi:hypothetical protein